MAYHVFVQVVWIDYNVSPVPLIKRVVTCFGYTNQLQNNWEKAKEMMNFVKSLTLFSLTIIYRADLNAPWEMFVPIKVMDISQGSFNVFNYTFVSQK